MPFVRDIPLTCPTCGYARPYALEPTEDRPLLALVTCPSCATPFAAEVRLTVTVETHVCRLALPSTRRPDALDEVQTLPADEDDLAF